MKAKFLFTAFAAALCLAACEQPVQDDFKAAFGVSGVTGNAISVKADAKDVTFTVSANISWSVSCDADWVSVEPASFENETKEVVDTKVTVKIAANDNEEAGRETSLSVGGEGVEPVVIKVSQAAKEHVYATISAFDVDGFKTIPDFAIALPGMNASVSFTLQATCDWTVEAPEWITIDPASATFDGENDLVTVTVSAENTAEAREGQIVFNGDIEAPYVVNVSQAAAPTISIESAQVYYPYCQMAFTITPNTEDEYYAYIYATSDVFESWGVDGLCRYMVDYRNNLLANNSVDIILAYLCYQGAETYSIDVDPETTYDVVTCGIAYDEVSGQFVQSTLGALYEVTTEVAPEAEEAYSANCGTYVATCFDWSGNEVVDFSMMITSYGINDTYKIYFPDDIISPVGSDGSVDGFYGFYNQEDGSIYLPEAQMGDLGFYWNYGLGADCAVVLTAYYFSNDDEDEDEDEESEEEEKEMIEWGFIPNEDNSVLSAYTLPGLDEGEYLMFGCDIYTEEGPTGYANGYVIVLSDFARVTVEEAASVKSGIVDPAAKSFKTLKAAGKSLK